MLIKVKGARAFQVAREEIKSGCRELNDVMAKKICYMDPGFDYEVSDAFGAEMIRRYPADFEVVGQTKTFPEPEVKQKKTKKG